MTAEFLEKLRSAKPVVHCITNYVTANDCANILLACGASAIMADDPDESAEITAIADGLVLNLGTPNPRKLEAMVRSGRCANERGIPVIFDPVGVGSSDLRRKGAARILSEIKISAIRGNASEIRTLVSGTAGHRGVDVDPGTTDAAGDARALARMTGAVTVLTGTEDVITDGKKLYRVHNGHQMMRSVTGAGCMLSALLGAFAAADREKTLEAALAAACAMGVCGETAFERLAGHEGNATFRNYIIDAIYRLMPEELERRAIYEAEHGNAAAVRSN